MSEPSCTAAERFGEDAGGYLLGALDAGERAQFERHLTGCVHCADEVARLRPVVGLLGGIGAADLAALDAAPEAAPTESLLPRLLARVAAERRRRRRVMGGLAAVAAAAVIALAAVLSGWPGSSPHPAHSAARQMLAVSANPPLRASAELTSRRWGTQIELDCRYLAAAWQGAPASYELTVVDRHGASHLLGSWTVRPTGQTRFTSGIALPEKQIRTVRIDLPDGTPVLQLTR